jgi:RimJ/RimL family protein N-acetyltransferase
MQLEIVRIFKGLEKENMIKEIPILDNRNQYIGKLKPIDIELAQDKNVIEALTKWRQKYMRFFMTQFIATPERTEKWLKEVVLKDNTRLLFLIYDENNKLIGNLGVCNINKQNAELDNVVRGEKEGHKRLIFFSVLTLINWLYISDVINIFLRVFNNNLKAVSLYSSIGFKPKQIFALQKNVNNLNEAAYIAMPNPPKEGQLGLILMELDKSNFISLYHNNGNK